MFRNPVFSLHPRINQAIASFNAFVLGEREHNSAEIVEFRQFISAQRNFLIEAIIDKLIEQQASITTSEQLLVIAKPYFLRLQQGFNAIGIKGCAFQALLKNIPDGIQRELNVLQSDTDGEYGLNLEGYVIYLSNAIDLLKQNQNNALQQAKEEFLKQLCEKNTEHFKVDGPRSIRIHQESFSSFEEAEALFSKHGFSDTTKQASITNTHQNASANAGGNYARAQFPIDTRRPTRIYRTITATDVNTAIYTLGETYDSENSRVTSFAAYEMKGSHFKLVNYKIRNIPSRESTNSTHAISLIKQDSEITKQLDDIANQSKNRKQAIRFIQNHCAQDETSKRKVFDAMASYDDATLLRLTSQIEITSQLSKEQLCALAERSPAIAKQVLKPKFSLFNIRNYFRHPSRRLSIKEITAVLEKNPDIILVEDFAQYATNDLLRSWLSSNNNDNKQAAANFLMKHMGAAEKFFGNFANQLSFSDLADIYVLCKSDKSLVAKVNRVVTTRFRHRDISFSNINEEKFYKERVLSNLSNEELVKRFFDAFSGEKTNLNKFLCRVCWEVICEKSSNASSEKLINVEIEKYLVKPGVAEQIAIFDRLFDVKQNLKMNNVSNTESVMLIFNTIKEINPLHIYPSQLLNLEFLERFINQEAMLVFLQNIDIPSLLLYLADLKIVYRQLLQIKNSHNFAQSSDSEQAEINEQVKDLNNLLTSQFVTTLLARIGGSEVFARKNLQPSNCHALMQLFIADNELALISAEKKSTFCTTTDLFGFIKYASFDDLTRLIESCNDKDFFQDLLFLLKEETNCVDQLARKNEAQFVEWMKLVNQKLIEFSSNLAEEHIDTVDQIKQYLKNLSDKSAKAEDIFKSEEAAYPALINSMSLDELRELSKQLLSGKFKKETVHAIVPIFLDFAPRDNDVLASFLDNASNEILPLINNKVKESPKFSVALECLLMKKQSQARELGVDYVMSYYKLVMQLDCDSKADRRVHFQTMQDSEFINMIMEAKLTDLTYVLTHEKDKSLIERILSAIEHLVGIANNKDWQDDLFRTELLNNPYLCLAICNRDDADTLAKMILEEKLDTLLYIRRDDVATNKRLIEKALKLKAISGNAYNEKITTLVNANPEPEIPDDIKESDDITEAEKVKICDSIVNYINDEKNSLTGKFIISLCQKLPLDWLTDIKNAIVENRQQLIGAIFLNYDFSIEKFTLPVLKALKVLLADVFEKNKTFQQAYSDLQQNSPRNSGVFNPLQEKVAKVADEDLNVSPKDPVPVLVRGKN